MSVVLCHHQVSHHRARQSNTDGEAPAVMSGVFLLFTSYRISTVNRFSKGKTMMKVFFFFPVIVIAPDLAQVHTDRVEAGRRQRKVEVE